MARILLHATGLLMLLMSTSCVPPERTGIITGELRGDLIWSGEVRLAGDVVLTEAATLTVLPGTKIRFLPPSGGAEGWTVHPHFPGSELIVKGRIRAIGAPDAPIVFEAEAPGAEPGAWGAVNINGSPEAIFEYCLFRQADSAIHSWDSNVYIEQSVFEDNLVGIRFNNSEILIENNLLRSNHTGVRFHFGAPVICNNRFEQNRVNLFITSFPRDYRIENNVIGPAQDYLVVLGEEVPDDVIMVNNYWAGAGVRDIYARVYDGRRTDYIGKLLIEPVMPEPPRHNGLSWTP